MTIRERSATDPAFQTIETLTDLQAAIRSAARNGQQLRVRGAMHSVRDAIVTDPGRGVDVILGGEFLNAAVLPWPKPAVGAGGGIRLGGDPDENIPPTSGLLSFMAGQKTPWAVPDLGGITHQSIGGFLSTGSSGGSLKYAFEDQIQRVTLVDGTGTVQTFDRDMADNEFGLAAVNLGLLGVIIEVDLYPVERFAIVGQESTTDIDGAAFKPFSSGTDGLAEFLRDQDYCRTMWWPQQKVDKLVTWTAKHVPLTPGFVPNPYRELGDPDEDPATWPVGFAELVGDLVYALIKERAGIVALYEQYKATLPEDMVQFLEQIVQAIIDESPEGILKILKTATSSELNQFGVDLYFSLLGNRKTNDLAKRLFADIFTDETTWESTWSPLIMNGIFLVDDARKVVPGPQRFQDYGDTGLPMDDQISDYLMPTEFTELWIPIEHTVDVMTTLRDHYAAGGYDATGTYACELYATKKSEFWMSPATAGDVIRVDLFWFARNGDQTPQQFYQPFWDLLRKAGIPFRPHWGKYLPPAATYGPQFYQGLYPQLSDFLAKRAAYDPNQVFVTDYWREQLGIPRP